jgi:hypothetical protein
MRQVFAQSQQPARRQRVGLTAREERAHDFRAEIFFTTSKPGNFAALLLLLSLYELAYGVNLSVNLWSQAPGYANGDGGPYAVVTGSANWLANYTVILTQDGDIGMPVIGKFSTARSVWMPQ